MNLRTYHYKLSNLKGWLRDKRQPFNIYLMLLIYTVFATRPPVREYSRLRWPGSSSTCTAFARVAHTAETPPSLLGAVRKYHYIHAVLRTGLPQSGSRLR
jgi:hypothetical protein